MKRTICLILILAFSLSLTFFTSAFLAGAKRTVVLESTETPVIPNPEISKSDFAARCRIEFDQAESKRIISAEDAYELVNLYFSGIDHDRYEGEMREAGLFVYSSVEVESDAAGALTSGAIIYNCALDQWIITFSGGWSDIDIIAKRTPFTPFPTAGKRVSIGGHDSLAIEFSSPSGEAPSMLDSFIRLSDTSLADSEIIRGPESYADLKGVIYKFDDYVTFNGWRLFGYDLSYRGAAFSVTAVYNSVFANFNAEVSGAYVHSYSTLKVAR